jgi:hypothetical protein
MAHRTFVLLGAMPIPVGHRVEVYILTKDTGVFSTNIEPVPDEPLVRDVDTGIYYGRTWQFRVAEGNATMGSITLPRTHQPGEHVSVAEKLEGRVAECRVLSEGIHDKQCAATTVVVDVTETAPVTFR